MRSHGLKLALIGLAAMAAVVQAPQAMAAENTLVSVSSTGEQGNGFSGAATISGDGSVVAFLAGASNLVAGDTNGVEDAFVRNLATGSTVRASVASDGTQANDQTYEAVISGNGRFVAFTSSATNLVPDDTNGFYSDVFVHDLVTGTTELASRNSAGQVSDGYSNGPSISADGRYIAFLSGADNLGNPTPDNSLGVYLRDLQTGTTSFVAPGGWEVSLSPDGRYLAYSAFYNTVFSCDPLTSDQCFQSEIFVRDLLTGTTTWISRRPDGTEPNGPSASPSISRGGSRVAFLSYASDLGPSDTNNLPDVYVANVAHGTVSLASVSSSGEQVASGYVNWPRISADGSHVTFTTWAGNLVNKDTNGVEDIFVRDLDHGTTEIASKSGGVIGNSYSLASWLTADGATVVFGSAATNLVDQDTNGFFDVYVHH